MSGGLLVAAPADQDQGGVGCEDEQCGVDEDAERYADGRKCGGGRRRAARRVASLTVGYGAAALAGQDEEGTLALVTALSIRRRTIPLQKAGAMATQALLLATAVAVCVLAGRGFELSISPASTIAVSVAVALMGLDFGMITMAAGAVTGRRGSALGIGAGLAAASYLLSSLASTISGIRAGRYLSLFYWSVGNQQISRGLSAVDFAVLLVVGLAVLLAAVAAFGRADLS
jgi:ABC-2 type transport system permease protein